jgi:hypothetical protein
MIPAIALVAVRDEMCDRVGVSDSGRLVSVLLVSRRHIDLRRVDSAVCQG